MEGAEDDLSEDTVPLPPRQDMQTEVKTLTSCTEQADNFENTSQLPTDVGETAEIQSQQSGEEIQRSDSSEIKQPHEFWPFNVLLAKISMKITDYEFRHLKTLHLGKIGSGVVEQCKAPIDFFNVMRKRCFLGPADVLNLQGMLWHLNRHDLMQLVVEYAESTKDVVYIHAASREPVNGYRHIKMHVSGQDFKHMSVERVNRIRSAVAGTLLIPSMYVLIDGVEPTNSIEVTFQIPETYKTIMKVLLQSKDLNVLELICLGVDKIVIDDEEYTITVLKMFDDEIAQQQQQQQADLYNELKCTKDTLSRFEIENVKLEKTVAEIEAKSLNLQADLDMWKGVSKPLNRSCQTVDEGTTKDKQDKGTPVHLKIPEFDPAFAAFNSSLDEISKVCPEKGLILNLLDSHVKLVAIHCYNELAAVIRGLQTQVFQLLSLVYKSKTRQRVARWFTGTEEDDGMVEMKTLGKISDKLLKQEEEQLQKVFGWTDDDRKEYKAGTVPFLTFLLRKEDKKHPLPGGVSFNEFLRICLTEKLNRSDLFLEYHKEIGIHKENERWNRRHNTDTIEGRALEYVSHQLTEKEKRQLKKEFNLTDEDKKEYEEESTPFLVFLLRKEDKKKLIKGFTDIFNFVKVCLTEKIDRHDLFATFLTEIENQREILRKSGFSEDRVSGFELQKSKSDATVIREMAGELKFLIKKVESIEKSTNLLKEPSIDNISSHWKSAFNISQPVNEVLETLFSSIP